jgi:hypothetical protein
MGMKFFTFYVVPAVLIAFAGTAVPALAATSYGGAVATPYVAAFAPLFGIAGGPHAGTMQLVFDGQSIRGTYSGDSVMPDRLDDRIVPVSGTIDPSDGSVQLQVGAALWFTGSVAGDGTMSGTATYDGRLYEFVAKPGSVRRQPDR